MFYHETAFLATFLLLSCYLLATLFGIPPYILRISFEYQWRDNDPLPFQYPSNTLPLSVQEAISSVC